MRSKRFTIDFAIKLYVRSKSFIIDFMRTTISLQMNRKKKERVFGTLKNMLVCQIYVNRQWWEFNMVIMFMLNCGHFQFTIQDRSDHNYAWLWKLHCTRHTSNLKRNHHKILYWKEHLLHHMQRFPDIYFIECWLSASCSSDTGLQVGHDGRCSSFIEHHQTRTVVLDSMTSS